MTRFRKFLNESPVNVNFSIADLHSDVKKSLLGFFEDATLLSVVEKDFKLVQKTFDGVENFALIRNDEIAAFIMASVRFIDSKKYLDIDKIQVFNEFRGANLGVAFLFWLKTLTKTDILYGGNLFKDGQSLIKRLANDTRWSAKWINLKTSETFDIGDVEDPKYRNSFDYSLVLEASSSIGVSPFYPTIPGKPRKSIRMFFDER